MNDYVEDLLLQADSFRTDGQRGNHYTHSAGLPKGSEYQKDHSNHYQEDGVSGYDPRLDRPKVFFH